MSGMSKKHYLGDSIYLEFVEWGIKLTTEDMPGDPSNEIELDPALIQVLKSYLDAAVDREQWK